MKDESRASIEAGGANIEPADEPAARPQPRAADEELGEPMKLGYAEAQRIADGRLGTAEVLGVGAPAIAALRALPLGTPSSTALSDEKVRAQVARFLGRLAALEKKFTDLKTAATTFPAYGEWLRAVQALRDAPAAATELLRIIDGERKKRALADLRVSASVYLQDGLLEWAEHKKMLWQAAALGLGPDDVEAVYRAFAPFTREPESEAARKAATGWPAHPLLKMPGEAWAWSLPRLRDAMLQRFDVAVEVATLPVEHKHSLFAYLEERDEVAREHARSGLAAATEAGCPQLAVWYFLWVTGDRGLHVTPDFHPAAERRRQVSSPAELETLLAQEWVLDDLAHALEGGLLENWAYVVAASAEAFTVAQRARRQVDRVPAAERTTFLRLAVLQVLRALGVRGLPLRDGAGRAVLVADLPSLVARSEDCWDALAWCLEAGALAEWLESIGEARQAERARECARMTV